VSPPDHLSALDASFLALDTPAAPLVVGWTLRFGGPAPPLAQLRRHLDARLGLVPRFRRRVVRPAFGLGPARWEDARDFDLTRHVLAATAPAPGGTAALREVAGVLLSAPLDADQPLWRMTLVDGLAGGGFALIGQAHHALVDGIAAMQVAMLLFGPAADDGPVAAWAPAPRRAAPVCKELAIGLGSRVSHPRSTVALGSHAVLEAGRALRGAGPGAARDAAVALEALARRGPRTSLQDNRTHRREVAWAQVDLDGVRATGRRHGATVNDTLLAASTLALGRLLRHRGEPVESLKVVVPVNVRGTTPAGALGNRISLLPVELPTGESDPVTVLRRVRDRTRAAKAAGAAGPLDALSRAADGLPAVAQRTLARAVMGAADYAAVISNVPGPPVELTLLGRPLRALLPSVPVPAGRGLTLGCVSYAGRLHIGLTADAEVVEEVVDLARELEAAFEVLRAEAPIAPTPWRARARGRRLSPPRAGTPVRSSR
jgi:diacylglycerol O-acyltransferase / wax synthase